MVSAPGPRSRALLEAPVLPLLLRLSAPGLLLVAAQAAVSITDAWSVGRLGTAPLAGLALVFPLVMLLQMTSAGAMGGGVASAIARALGAGREAEARRLVVHGLAIAAAMGVVFTAVLLAFGRPLYRLLGGEGAVIEDALRYSDVLFGGAALVWLSNTLAAVLRGSGNTLVPALALIAGAALHAPLSVALVAGDGGVPRLGMRGAALAYVAGFALAATLMLAALWRSALRPRAGDFALETRLFREILRVGAVSSLGALQTVATAVILAGLVGRYGKEALAGWGLGVRLELLQIPIVFAIGQALVALVGTNVGAGRTARAKRIAWTGAALAVAVTATVGFGAALFPLAWLTLFSDDPGVLEAGSRYLRTVGPLYPLLGVSISLYFAAQGAGRIWRPMLAGTARLAVIVAGGSAVLALALPLGALFAVMALGMLVQGALTAIAVARADWR